MKKRSFLTYEDRIKIEAMLRTGECTFQIAAKIGRNASVIYRELTRNSTKGVYNAQEAERMFKERSKAREVHKFTSSLETLDLFCPLPENSEPTGTTSGMAFSELKEKISTLDDQLEILLDLYKELESKVSDLSQKEKQ